MTASGYVHDLLLYDSDEEFLAVAVPYVAEGLDAGEVLAVNTSAHNRRLLHGALGSDVSLGWPATLGYDHPARALGGLAVWLRDEVERGASGFRIVREIDYGGAGWRRLEWLRYESATNRALQPFSTPIHGLCPYDLRSVPLDLVAIATRAHPNHVDGSGRSPNEGYEQPEAFLRSNVHAVTRLSEPTATATIARPDDLVGFRRAMSTVTSRSQLSSDDVDAFVVAVFEVVTNALFHGRPPIEVRLAARGPTLACSVTDDGPGFDDPLVGYLPVEVTDAARSCGLWLARQLCDVVATGWTDGGFTVALHLGAPD